jgi:hypothetical protein
VPNPAGTYTYAWSASSGTITGASTTSTLGMDFTGVASTAVLTLTLSGANTCSTITTYSVFPCCSTRGATTVFPTNYTFTSNIGYSSGVYIFTGSVTINPNVFVSFTGCEVKMNPSSSILASTSSTLDLITSYVHGCNAQWNGIYNASSATTDFETCIVEDAQRVFVDSVGSGTLYSVNSIFNKNYKGFVFKNSTTSITLNVKDNAFTNADFTSTLSTISYAVPVALTPSVTNAAATYSALPSINLLPPYSSLTAKTGMECVKTTSTSSGYIRLGHSITNAPIGNANQNIFHRLSEGIATYNSKVQIVNQYFQYNTASPTGAGVYVYGSSLSSGISDVKVGVFTTEKCYFYSNTNGVLNTFPSNLLVQNCSFVDNSKCVYVKNNFRGKVATVTTCTFTNNDLGVKMEDNFWIDGEITSNTFTNTVPRLTYNNNYAVYVSEFFAPPTTTQTAYYDVFSNTIGGYYNGVFVSQTYGSTILTNSISVRAATVAASYQEGVEVTLCNIPSVKLNTISIAGGSNTSNWQMGILTNMNTLPSVTCNNITGLGSAITVQGLNWTSANGNGYCQNIMTGYGYGMWLDMSAEIGDQFTYSSPTKYSADNQWNASSSIYKTRVTGMSNMTYTAGGIIYTRSTPSQYTINATTDVYPNTPSCQAIIGCALLGTNSSPASLNSCTGGGGGGSPLMSGNSTPTLEIIQPALDIAQNKLSFSDNNDNLQWLNQRSLYQNLMLQNIDTNPYPDLSSFKTKTSSNSIGQFNNVDALFKDAIISDSKSSITNALILNNSVKSSNAMEWNQKTVNNIYASYLSNNGNLDKIQIAELERISELCPITNGVAVYKARTLVFNYTGKKYTSSCEHTQVNDSPGTGNRLANSSSENSQTVENEIKIYPNPSSSEIFIETGRYTNCELIMFNLLGQQVIKQIVNGKTKIDVNHLNNGTYFYSISQNETVLKRDKLIITH